VLPNCGDDNLARFSVRYRVPGDFFSRTADHCAGCLKTGLRGNV
jgi:hypothetical protein